MNDTTTTDNVTGGDVPLDPIMAADVADLDTARQVIDRLRSRVKQLDDDLQLALAGYYVELSEEHERKLHILYEKQLLLGTVYRTDPYWDDEPELSEVLTTFVQDNIDVAWDMAFSFETDQTPSA